MKKFIVSLFSLMVIAVSAMAQECSTPGTVTATVRLVRKPSTLLFGQFTVADGVKVSFSKGNLQYQASTETWRFAENQYDYIGDAVGNTTAEASRATQSNWIDLFGYGTSGESSKYPYMVSTTASDYYASDIADTDYDWGKKNYTADVDAGYRVLTQAEWTYLLATRTNASSLRGLAVVCGKNGLVLLPDDWSTPAGTSFTATITDFTNTYDASKWAIMEAAGAVFLPAAGQRSGESVGSVGSQGYYWSATAGHGTSFAASSVNGAAEIERSLGCSVRLVQTL